MYDDSERGSISTSVARPDKTRTKFASELRLDGTICIKALGHDLYQFASRSLDLLFGDSMSRLEQLQLDPDLKYICPETSSPPFCQPNSVTGKAARAQWRDWGLAAARQAAT